MDEKLNIEISQSGIEEESKHIAKATTITRDEESKYDTVEGAPKQLGKITCINYDEESKDTAIEGSKKQTDETTSIQCDENKDDTGKGAKKQTDETTSIKCDEESKDGTTIEGSKQIAEATSIKCDEESKDDTAEGAKKIAETTSIKGDKESNEKNVNLQPTDNLEEGEEEMDEDEWKEEFTEILDDIDKKGDFCVGKEVSTDIPRFSPQITVDGMDKGEQLAFPLMDYQAKRLRSFAEKAPFGKGMDTVLDESVRKAWQIDAAKVKFYDTDRWHTALRRIVLDSVASLGMTGSEQAHVEANLYKLLLYEPGGHFKKHRDTEKEPGMFGTLIIQLPSKFSGGSLVIRHADETKTLDFSTKSNEGIFASAFYADCEHELLPVQSGWRLCLAYNLVMCQKDDISKTHKPLPSACALTAQTQKLRNLVSHWDSLALSAHGYLLEHDYTERNLHFANLKGRDKEVVDFLMGSRDIDGNPLFVVCLMLIEKHDSGSAEDDRYYEYSRRGYYSYDVGNHTMEEVHNSEVGIRHWIGPDDEPMNNFRLDFDLEESLLTVKDTEELFGDNPSREEYESYTGNAGPSLEYWYYRSAVVFWPRAMNVNIIKSAGVSYMLSYVKVAVPSEMLVICNQIVEQIEEKKIRVSSEILTTLCKINDDVLLVRLLKSCPCIPDAAFAQQLAKICISKSNAVETEILELVTKKLGAVQSYRYGNVSGDPLTLALGFFKSITTRVSAPFFNTVRANIVLGALTDTNTANAMNSANAEVLAKMSFESGSNVFQCFCNAAKANITRLSTILKCLIELGDSAVKHPLVIELANIRAKQLHLNTMNGLPVFTWRQLNANFTGSQSTEVNSFLRGEKQSATFHHFNGIGHARNWASKYFGRSNHGYSANAIVGGRGRSSYVTVTKTITMHEKVTETYSSNKQELSMLENTFKDSLEVSIVNNVTQGRNRRKQASDNGPPSKKPREVIVID